MFSLTTFNKRYHSQPRYTPTTRTGTTEIKSEIKSESPRSNLGQFPLTLLEMVVRNICILDFVCDTEGEGYF